MQLPPPTAEEISAKIPPQGLPLVELIQMFRGRVADNTQFIGMVKRANVRFDKETRTLYPKEPPA